MNLRLPEELKDEVAKLAEKNGRSANAEMVAAIEAWVKNSELDSPKKTDQLFEKVAHLEQMLIQIAQRAEYPSPASMLPRKDKD